MTEETKIKQESIRATVERVTFHNPDNGFSVLQVAVKDQQDLITVVGNTQEIHAGELLICEGEWQHNRQHGVQFKANQILVNPPDSLEGIRRYLASGLIKGVGKHFADLFVEHFGKDILDIIEKEPARLLSLPGMGEKKLQLITESWQSQRKVREIILFLHSHGVGTARAYRIYKTYGEMSIEILKTNPYRLALDIFGIGFKTADELALKLGFKADSPLRLAAALRHYLQQEAGNGHCAMLKEDLLTQTSQQLQVSKSLMLSALAEEMADERIIASEIKDQSCVYLAALYHAERNVAEYIECLQSGPLPWKTIDSNKAIPWVESKTGIQLSESQCQAIATALKYKVIIITGGPGVGKTTIVNSLLRIVKTKIKQVLLCAPTGRAAKRLSESTGCEAKTIHRVLEYDPRGRSFKRNEHNPLECDLLVVDESSMLDIMLLNHLLKAIPTNSGLVLVGDIDQLPSVGPGRVLQDMIASKMVATVKLTEIFRQAGSSQIVVNAHRINQGEFIHSNTDNKTLTDFYVIPANSPEDIVQKLLTVVTKRIPQRFHFNPKKDIQVLAPMQKTLTGVQNLNLLLQKTLNGHSKNRLSRFGTTFAEGDKIIQTVNNYDKDIYNGDIGIITSVNMKDNQLVVDFGDQNVSFELNELDELRLAYAISIHKSQGSEYPVVVIPVTTQHFMMLARNLIYTGVTRGKKLVVLIAEPKALAIAVKNQRSADRLTNLEGLLTACQKNRNTRRKN
ncbi:MAG: recombinase RecD [Gammaproteobacteria bacterium RIFCSPHIGHO2_12_FULL_41_15]|nr:MAG: recombinase RecD [Gammaproteobacteria bacterium RIFCSPHIGHO2_12_FULL_41_15]